MKTIQSIFVLVIMLLSINTISAQYGNGYGGGGYGGNGYGGGGYGNQGGRDRGLSQDNPPDKPKEIPVEVTVAKIMDEMKVAVNLDELQVIAISNVLIESMKSQGMILKIVTNQEDQIKDFKALAETTDRKINEFLNEDQKPKYIAFKEDRKIQKKSKSKSKKTEK